MICRGALSVGAALVALACSGCHPGRPMHETDAVPAPATADTASAPAAAPVAPPPATSPPEEIAMNATTNADAPPATPSAAPVPSDPSQVRRITIEETDAIRQSGSGVIVDVRDDNSFNMGHIKGALHIPLDQLAQRLGELPRDKPIVTYCA
jgi:Rhodanese-like domain